MSNFTDKGVYMINENRAGISIKPSSSGALKGAATGALIGCRFGPVGLAVGTGIGGVLGYLFDD